MKNLLLTLFNYKYMHKYRNVTILLAIFVLCTITYVLESTYNYTLAKNKEEYAESGELVSESSFFYNIEAVDISNIKEYKFKVVNNEMVGELEENIFKIFSYDMIHKDKIYQLILIFDIYNLNIKEEIANLYNTYKVDKKDNSFIFVFGKDTIYYQNFESDINILSYDYIYFDINEVSTLNDLGKIIALSFTQVYIDYKVSEYTVVCLLCTIVFPIVLTWVIFKFIGSRIKYQKFTEFLNIMVYSSILPFVIIAVGTLINEQIIYFFDILLFVYFIYNVMKISKDESLEYNY